MFSIGIGSPVQSFNSERENSRKNTFLLEWNCLYALNYYQESTHEYDRLVRSKISVLFHKLYKHISWFDGDLDAVLRQILNENVLDTRSPF